MIAPSTNRKTLLSTLQPAIPSMTRGSDAFWEVLNDKFHCFLIDSGLECTTSALSCCLFLVFLHICFSMFLRPRKEDQIHTRAALRALLSVVVPTCSLWPGRYIKFASAPCSRIDIPLEVIIEDTINGVIEFCNPINDLADLIDSGATVNGHTICINIGWKWWIKYFQWWMLAKPKSGPSNWLRGNMLGANPSPPGPSSSPFALTSSTSDPLLCLDSLPHSMIPSLNAGCKVTLEFTAFSPSLRILSVAQVISAIPFIISEHSRRQPRPLVSVLKQLNASYGPNLVIDLLSNVSADYENALRHVYKSLSGEPKIPKMRVRNLGVQAWRRDMFLVALEAALVRRGWIERWAVQVTIK